MYWFSRHSFLCQGSTSFTLGYLNSRCRSLERDKRMLNSALKFNVFFLGFGWNQVLCFIRLQRTKAWAFEIHTLFLTELEQYPGSWDCYLILKYFFCLFWTGILWSCWCSSWAAKFQLRYQMSLHWTAFHRNDNCFWSWELNLGREEENSRFSVTVLEKWLATEYCHYKEGGFSLLGIEKWTVQGYCLCSMVHIANV